MIDDYDESSGWMFFWYRLTRVFPDKFHRAVKRLCVCCVCVCTSLTSTKHFNHSLATWTIQILYWCYFFSSQF